MASLTPEDPWIPPEKTPSLLSAAGRSYLFTRFKNFILATWSVRSIKKNLSGWNPKDFAKQSQDAYILMNQAYLGNRKEEVKTFVTPSMMAQLNPSMGIKDMRYDWKYHGNVDRPKMVHSRIAKTQLEVKGKEHMIAQCTIRTHTNQSLSVFKGGRQLIAGKVCPVLEYIVMERIITLPGQKWLIAGKILPEEEPKPKGK